MAELKIGAAVRIKVGALAGRRGLIGHIEAEGPFPYGVHFEGQSYSWFKASELELVEAVDAR